MGYICQLVGVISQENLFKEFESKNRKSVLYYNFMIYNNPLGVISF